MTMYRMFFVRALHPACCCSIVAMSSSSPISSSPRSEIAAHSARPPVPRCAVVRLCLQSAHRRLGRELGDEHVPHVLCTCLSITRVAALASLCRPRRPSPIPSFRDRRSLHTTARPSLRCSMPRPSIRTSARGASNRFRRSPDILTSDLHSHRLRRTSRNGGMELWPAARTARGQPP